MAAFLFDASGIVKRYLTEIGSPWVQGLTDPAAAHELFLTRLTRVEIVAAIARRSRGVPLPAAADQDLNAAAIAEGGLDVDDPTRQHMMSVFTARLEASDPARDCFRSYRLDAGPDLFGAWLVEATYGRIGSRGRTVRHVAADEAGAQKIVRHCLQRRATAPERIGIPYRLRELHDPRRWTLDGLSFSIIS